jgi:hypothetical protein
VRTGPAYAAFFVGVGAGGVLAGDDGTVVAVARTGLVVGDAEVVVGTGVGDDDVEVGWEVGVAGGALGAGVLVEGGSGVALAGAAGGVAVVGGAGLAVDGTRVFVASEWGEFAGTDVAGADDVAVAGKAVAIGTAVAVGDAAGAVGDVSGIVGTGVVGTNGRSGVCDDGPKSRAGVGNVDAPVALEVTLVGAAPRGLATRQRAPAMTPEIPMQ